MKDLYFFCFLFFFGLTIFAKVPEEALEKKMKYAPINSNASEKVHHLLDFLYQIEGDYILSGHHNYHYVENKFSDAVKKITGVLPAVIGTDFSFSFNGKDPQEVRDQLMDQVIDNYNNGYIITLMWHCCFPADGDSCNGDESIWKWQPGVSEEDWKELVTEGTELNDQWKAQVDRVAEHLKKLQEHDIPVLWRPYHEMNGVWFWWCNKRGDDGFVKLWKMMYERFTFYHQLNNLIWVWNANAPRDKEDDEAYDYELFFPGIDYVDVLAADVYHNDYRQSHHDQLIELGQGKPISLGEVGRMPNPQIIQDQPNWTWFMGWANWLFKANNEEDVKELYLDPKVITLDELQRDEKGNYRIILKKDE